VGDNGGRLEVGVEEVDVKADETIENTSLMVWRRRIRRRS